jgi:hypothetical protein
MSKPHRPPRSTAYRLRAEECRSVAESFNNADTRRKLHKIADEYDRMAMQAATLEIQLQELAASLPPLRRPKS